MTIASFLMQLWSGYALPLPHQKIKTRIQCNPAEIHLTFAGSCSNKRDHLILPASGRLTGNYIEQKRLYAFI